MSRMGKDISRGFRGLRKALGGPVFTFDGEDYPCVPNQGNSSKLFGVGGFALEADQILFVERKDLPNPPLVLKDEFIYKGRTYRIDHIGDLPGDDQVKLFGNDPDSGAG